MNKKVLKSPGFWIAMISAVVGQLISGGVVLSGTAPCQVLGYVLTLAGVLTGHAVTLPPTQAPTDAPAAPASTN